MFHSSPESDDLCESVCSELAVPLSFDCPALAGVWKIPISPAGEGVSKAEAMISNGSEREGEEVSEAIEAGAGLGDFGLKKFQLGRAEVKSRSAKDEKERKELKVSGSELGSRK